MSYILDALKKRHAEDDPDAAVSLALAQAQKTEVQQRKQTGALWVIGAALLVNAVVLGIWALRDDDTPSVEPPSFAEDAPDPTPEITASATPDYGRPRQEQRDAAGEHGVFPAATKGRASAGQESGIDSAAQPAVTPSTPITASRVGAESPSRLPAVLSAVTLDELSSAERAEFGELEFSSHVYGDLSWVVVNGQRLEIGDQLGALRLQAITEEGVEFAFRQYLVSISVIASWEQ
ncbi:MAG: general secretion pathway protein GspB [Kiritimatiellia bacterium]|jgi:hypothetical protein|nr:general secretion pathway protein GspB [Pseudomonadales bacterium]MDP6470915.1 general secretion pathway protein GspB [Pseudomonadales bacterium]MDP6825900.1 general secretion pathway protein GspB [Pseudomonadales bacterium]MDP7024560.1 general secretion pathway protein GspB [Kiritimatiellia bacterium]|tara:strand:+ start:2087 stop:2791 length:705 start_codon:yes stop_codon:yes gene_type:complete